MSTAVGPSPHSAVLLRREISVDFGKAMERMRRLRAEISVHDSVERFSNELGVDVFLGSARFSGRDSIEVVGKRLRFRKAAVCTCPRAAVPPIPGLPEAGYLTNENVFALTELPPSIPIRPRRKRSGNWRTATTDPAYALDPANNGGLVHLDKTLTCSKDMNHRA